MSLLGPSFYDKLQTFIYGDFAVASGFFLEQFKRAGFREGDSVTDIGCGTGLISSAFTTQGFNYTGLEMAEERVEAAKVRNPEGRFLCGNLTSAEILSKLDLKFCIMHGVIHHLSDAEVTALLETLRANGCKVLATMDPLRPAPDQFRPVAKLLCDLDEGKFVRRADEYQALYSGHKELGKKIYKYPRWPAEILYMAVQLG